ncbi:hypothetical protein N6H13_27355 [Paenibacillus sp. CC-CFT742]|nr:hypothetical protein [Paenibacillus sp. CC-CFT742]WJH28660.1 hypothetical protein N6H13_27355 [Paenibacillus sp. CC-CFT742]
MMTFVYGGKTYYITSKTLQSFIKETTSPAKKQIAVAGKVTS